VKVPPMLPSAEERRDTLLAHLNNAWHDGSVVICQSLTEAYRDGFAAALAMLKQEPVVEAASRAGLLEFCQPNISVAWSELQPAATRKWRRIGRATVRAAADAIDTCAGAAPEPKMTKAAECYLDGQASPEPVKPQGNAT
jgi:hypothetical protein